MIVEYTACEGGLWNKAECSVIDFMDAMETNRLKVKGGKRDRLPAAMRIKGSPIIYDFVIKERWPDLGLVRNWV